MRDVEKITVAVNKIIPFSNVDGPGNRLAIFFQECNLRCIYCHNPETLNKCIHCGECVPGCPTGAIVVEGGMSDTIVVFDQSKCIECDQCIRICRFNSSSRTRVYTSEDILKEIEEYKLFIRGITVSGGEPTLQAPFVTELFRLVKPTGLSCFVDTNGVFDIESKEMKELIDATDKFMVDIKGIGETIPVCGVQLDNHLVNLKKLLELDKVYEVRTVLIKNFMDMENTIRTVSSILKDYPKVKYKLIRVHPAGLQDEIRQTIMDNVPGEEEVLRMARIAREAGVKIVETIL